MTENVGERDIMERGVQTDVWKPTPRGLMEPLFSPVFRHQNMRGKNTPIISPTG
jgi:hypothetical protein